MSVTPEQPVIPKIRLNAILNVMSKGVHTDKRPLHSYRQIEIKTGVVPNAEGSALVKLGNTQVIAGVKLEVGQPYPDTPNEGVLIVNTEFVPAASPTFEPGPPDENAIELARVIDRSLREPRVIDLSKLVIIPGKKVWLVWLDIYVLDHDGNLLDASMLAAMAALATTKIPKYEVNPGTGEVVIDRTTRTTPLPISKFVATVTVNKIGNYLVIDPNQEEESIATARLAISVSEDGTIVGMQKMGMGYFTEDEIVKAIELALQKGPELINTIKASIGMG
ncbi:MAG TPA: exosome complex protein Rrp42 [Ignisphaera aggregans]|uniref:Exosome complex component Rrp42 n=1 Tax=Ignisphaera aggregans TaxID=334771 RepID=A0A832YXX2_9CREN|nr:exosome complex protein Rrp42 [Ignisphaera aggregans]